MGSSIVTTFTEAFTGITSGIASGVVDTFNAVFMDGEGLSNIAIWGIVMGAVALGIGLIRKFTSKAG